MKQSQINILLFCPLSTSDQSFNLAYFCLFVSYSSFNLLASWKILCKTRMWRNSDIIQLLFIFLASPDSGVVYSTMFSSLSATYCSKFVDIELLSLLLLFLMQLKTVQWIFNLCLVLPIWQLIYCLLNFSF